MTAYTRVMEENIFGGGTPRGGAWLRRAVEKTGVDVSGVTGPWAKKLYVALGGDPTGIEGKSWMRLISDLLDADANAGSWEAKVAAAIEQGGGITHPTFDTDQVTFDSDKFTMDNQ